MTQGRRSAAVEAVKTALKAKDQPGAILLARKALDAGERHPLLLNLRAYWYETENQLVAALADLKDATILAPDDPTILNAYGLCLTRLDRPAKAVAVFRRVTALKPGFGPAWFSLGHVAERINDLQTARGAYERATALSPDFPTPFACLATLAARRGDWASARTQAEKALSLDPTLQAAERAIVAAEIAERRFIVAERRIVALLSDPRPGWEDRYLVCGLLGDLRHAQGRYAEAFDAYTRGGRAAQDANAERFAARQSALGVVGWLTRHFAAARAWPRAAASPDQSVTPEGGARGHAFLLGFVRSGTTLLEQALAARPDVATLEEQEALADSARTFMAAPAGLTPLAALDQNSRQIYADLYWRRVREFGVDPEGRLFIDKLPFNTLKLPLIAQLFPGAKVLFALRDPRDVVLSCLRQRFRVGAYTFELLTPEAAARFYAATMTLAALYAEKLPLDIRYVRHEAVVEDFEGELRATSAFLGLDWDKRVHDFAARAATHPAATPSAVQLQRGLSREGLGQWRNYRTQLEPILPILQPWVARYGYPAS
jgi:Tfp pilus assembly protein PilF